MEQSGAGSTQLSGSDLVFFAEVGSLSQKDAVRVRIYETNSASLSRTLWHINERNPIQIIEKERKERVLKFTDERDILLARWNVYRGLRRTWDVNSRNKKSL